MHKPWYSHRCISLNIAPRSTEHRLSTQLFFSLACLELLFYGLLRSFAGFVPFIITECLKLILPCPVFTDTFYCSHSDVK